MLLGPILTCDSMVWWPRFKYDTNRMHFNQLQRFTCLAITGATMTTPILAMGFLLGLSLLHVIIEAEAQTLTYKITYNHQWKPKSTKYGHTETSRDMEHEPILLSGT